MSLLSKAKSLPSAKTAAAKPKRTEIQIAQLQQLSEIAALMGTLKATYTTIEAEVKAAGFDEFIAMAGSIAPDSFRGIDGMASASVEMRKRGTNSPLNEEEIKTLRALEIEPFEQTVQTELYAIDPKYAGDPVLMAKLEKAAGKFLPDDFFVKQDGITKFVVNEAMINKAFELKNRAALTICSTMALKPTLNEEYPMANLFDNVKEIIQPSKKKMVLPGRKAA